MSTDFAFLLIAIVLSVAYALVMARLVRGIPYYAHKTDNELIIKAAAQAHLWGFPSGMHTYANGKAHMKEAAVLVLALVQRLLGDTKSDRALVMLCVWCNAFSAFLIYLIATAYWGTTVGMICFALFLCSFWPHMIALWGGVVLVAQMLCLVSILFLQSAGYVSFPAGTVLTAAAGFFFGALLFSSASSRRYVVLCAAAFFWGLRDFIGGPCPTHVGLIETVLMIVGGVLVLGWAAAAVLLKPVLRCIYDGKAPGLLNKVIDRTKLKPFEHYLDLSRATLAVCGKVVLVIVAYLAVNYTVSRSLGYWVRQGAFFNGAAFAFVALTFPHVVTSLKGYYIYSSYGKPIWKSRFDVYRDYFARIGHPIPEGMRGGGWSWLVRYFNLMSPALLWTASILGILYIYRMLVAREPVAVLDGYAVLVLVCLTPVLIGEMTRAVQVGRSSYPGQLGLIVLTGLLLGKFNVGALFLALAAALYTAREATVFFGDILPSRMAVRTFLNDLRSLGINEFYTLETNYNDMFVRTIPSEEMAGLKVHYVRTLADVPKGSFAVIPPVNPVSALMYDYPQARETDRSFRQDPELDRLLTAGGIEQRAVKKYPTLSSSRYWLQEGEVPTYRDLILRDVTDKDQKRGYAWLVRS